MTKNGNDTDLIIAILREQDEKRSLQIKGLYKNMESGFEAFNIKLDHIKEGHQNMLLLIDSQGEEMEKLKKDTKFWRLIHKNPKVSFIIICLLFSGIVGILSYLNNEEIEMIIKKFIGL